MTLIEGSRAARPAPRRAPRATGAGASPASSGAPSSSPRPPAGVQARRAPRGSPGRRRAARRRRRRSRGSALAAAPSGGTTARIGRSAARYSNTFPERTPRPRPPASGIRSSSASESRWSSSERRRGNVRDQLEPVAEPEALGPLAVGGAEVADEAGDDVEPRLGERGQERPRVAPAEEAAGVRDPEAGRVAVLEPGEVVEVAAVRDRDHRAPRARARASRPRSPRRR